jgi:hypothetical protein
MSQIINGATHALNWNGFGWEDVRLNRMDFLPWREMQAVFAIAIAPYNSEWWPGGAKMFGEPGVNSDCQCAVKWGEYDQAGGASSRFGFVGVTRDAYGTMIPACNVKLFRTSDDLLLDSTVSNASGEFLLNTAYYPDAHYIVAHKTASPDVDGVSVNTLVGT